MAGDSKDSVDSRSTIENTLQGLQNAKQFAFDIGLSLVKIAYSSTVSRPVTTVDCKVNRLF